MSTLIVQDNPPDWQERYRLMFEKHELFMFKLCEKLGLDFQVTAENDILEKLEEITDEHV